MKIYIFVDMEGISGISGSDHVTGGGPLYQEGRRFMTQDINACVRGCVKAGATEIVVRDGHGCGRHVLWDQLEPEAQLIQGQGTRNIRLDDIEGSDAIILLGYHAKAGALGALLEHTYSSKHVQNLWLNEQLVGEFAIDAAIAAEYGVPTIMVSGDDKACAEAREWLPEVVTCQVKQSNSTQGTKLMPMKQAHQLIEDKTVEAINKLAEMPCKAVAKPVTLRLEVIERGGLRGGSRVKVIDGRTIEVEADSLEEAFYELF